MLHDSEFQAIVDQYSQFAFLQKYTIDECNVSMNDKKLTAIYQISEGHARQFAALLEKEKNISVSRSADLTNSPTIKKEK
jgi:hypothetical protein